MKFKLNLLPAFLMVSSMYAAAADPSGSILDKVNFGSKSNSGSSSSSEDSPWDRRMEDVSGLFGAKVQGSAVNKAGKGGSLQGFDTFTPFQENKQNMVAAYGSTEVGIGCNGLNLGTVLDGQIGQYAEMVEQFIQNAPTLAIMFLAYSQPTVKSVIDQLNTVGQFGLDLSNLTCSGVRNLADKAYEAKKQSLAEADCTADAGYKSTECMSGEGITGNLAKQMGEVKEKMSSRASALMGSVSSATGGLIGVKGGGSPGTGTGTGTPGSTGSNNAVGASKSCAGKASEGTTALLLAASEMQCDDITKYAGLLPTYSTADTATTVTPRTESLETVSKSMTTDYMSLLSNIYTADPETYEKSEAYKDLVNRSDTVVSDGEYKFMRELGKTNPVMFAAAQRNLATLAMMKELDGVVSRLELGVMTGLSNQPDNQLISPENIDRYMLSAKALRKEYEILQSKITADVERNKLLQSTYQSVVK